MRKFILLVVSAPVFWIYLGVIRLFFLVLEGMGEWLELLGDEDEDEDKVEEK